MKEKMDIYQIVTDQVIEALEEGIIPWKKTWNSIGGSHMNLASKTGYRGMNPFLLEMVRRKNGYTHTKWGTFKQISAKGGKVNKGEKGTLVIFWKIIKKEDVVDGEKQKSVFPILRYYKVWNIEQTDLPLPELKEVELTLNEKIKNCEKIIEDYEDMPEVLYGDPAYSPSLDKLYMPKIGEFESSEEYYAAIFHEMVHSTKHKTRLNRDENSGISFFGSEDYSKEELVAEMGACFLANKTGIENEVQSNQVAYIKGWLKKLKNDKKLLISASGQSQRAVDYIEGIVKVY